MTDTIKIDCSFPKLGANNFPSWRVNAELALESAGVWDWIKPGPNPKDKDNKEIPMSDKVRVTALRIIRFNMEESQLKFVGVERDPKKAWAMLIKAKESNTSMTLVAKLTELMTLQQGDDPVEDLGARIKGLVTDLEQAAGKDISKFITVLAAAAFVKSLDKRYESFAVSVLQMDANKLDIDDMLARASAEQLRQQNRDTSTAQSELVATASFARANNKGGNKLKLRCTYCDRLHHTVDECRTKMRDEKKANGQTPAGAHGANMATGHHATMALATDTTRPASEWLIDSAATIHMCHDRSMFTAMRAVDAVTVMFGGGQSVTATEAGDMRVVIKMSEGTFHHTLVNVLFVSEIKRNLISMMQWASQGITCKTTLSRDCLVLRDNHEVGRVYGAGNLLPVAIIPTPVKKPAKHTANMAQTVYSSKWELAHCRLGHLHNAAMKALPAMADGLDYSPSGEHTCATCAKGKLSALSHPQAATHRATKPLELVHTDVCGPLPQSYDGFKYFVTFIDDCTRFVEVALLKQKSDVLRAFLTFQQRAEKEAQRGIGAVRSDNGGEYLSKAFNDLLSIDGVQRQLSAPYTPQQNGVAERFNRTLMDMARPMLIHSGLDTRFWSSAVLQAAHLRNRVPTTALNNMTPYQAFYGQKPSLSHVRVFGCLAYAVIPKPKRTKLDPKGRLCIHLGSPNGYKAYRLYDPTTKEMFISRNVRFVENQFADDNTGQVGAMGTGNTETVSRLLVVTSETSDEPSEATEPNSNETSTLVNNPVEASGSSSESDAIDNHECHDVQPASPSAPQTDESSSPAPTLAVHSNRSSGAWSRGYDMNLHAGDEFDAFIDRLQSEHPALCNSTLNADRQTTLQSIIDKDKVGKTYMLTDIVKALKMRRADRQRRHAVPMAMIASHMAHAALAAEEHTPDPRSRKEAMSSPARPKWEKAEREELDSIERAKVYELCQLPPGHRAIGNKFVYKTKRDENGNVIKHKARLVAKGFTQREGIDYDETFSPVLQYASLRCLLAMVAHYDLELHQMDVKTAFLNGDIDHEIYMKQPEGHEVPGKEDHVCKLKKSLYGLKQAGRVWYERIHAEFTAMGFTRLVNEPCTYVKRSKECVIIIGLYVDDLVLISNSLSQLKATKHHLSKQFEMKDLGEARFILGIKIDRDRANRKLTISQTEYIRSVVDKYGMTDSRKNTHTPMNPGAKLVKTGLVNAPVSQTVDIKEYQAAVGSIMYAMLGTRPDIAHSISKLAQYSSDPRLEHWKALMQLLRYLATTADHGLVYDGHHDDGIEPTLVGYTDSDWANDPDSRRSVTGYLFRMAGGAISWKSKRQPTVALSSTEAEYMAASEAAREAANWRTFLRELGFDMSEPTLILSDNQGSIALAKNPEHHARSKHIDVRHHYVREQVASQAIRLQYINTEEMVADLLTKPLPRDRHHALAKEMGLAPPPHSIASTRRLSGSVGNTNGALK
jgi:transposase InsO family protein